MKALVSKQYRLPFALIISLFFLWGAAHAILDVLNKHFQEVMHLTLTHSAMVQVMFYLGYFVMAIPAGLLIDRKGYRTGVVTGLLLYGAGALMFWPGASLMSFNFFLCSLFIIACGLVFLETAANPYVTELGDRETAPSRLNLAQSFNGLGCICGPLFGGMLLFTGTGNERIALPYVAMGITALAVAFVFTRMRLPEMPHAADTCPDAPRPGNALRRLLANRPFLFGLFALLNYEISEISINSFFIIHVTDAGWMDSLDASVVLSFGGLGLFMLGRIAGSLIMQRIPGETVLHVCAIGALFSTLLVMFDLGILSLCALMLIYVFESIMFPTIFALSLRGLGPLTKRASSLLMMTPIGGAIGTFLMGFMADATGTTKAFVVPAIGFIWVVEYAFYVKKQTKKFG